MTPDQEYIADLKDQLWDAQETIRKLMGALASSGTIFPRAWQLDPQEAKALAVIWLTEESVSSDDLAIAITKTQTLSRGLAQVVIGSIRKKIPQTITITAKWGQGYHMPAASKSLLSRTVLGQASALSTSSIRARNNLEKLMAAY